MNTEVNSMSHLEKTLRSGEFAVTVELSPPDSADPQEVFDAAEEMSKVSDGLNATDAPGANCHMSSAAMSALLRRANYEPVMQMTCRDRNRIAIQGDLLGAAALGIKNVLCLTGDDATIGDQPQAKQVFDFDSIQLLRTAANMRDNSMFLSGRKISVAPRFFLGAAANPFVPPFDWRPLRLAKKVAAGADFIQTQYCFDVAIFRYYMRRVRDLGLHEKVFILVGVGPLRSDRTARYLQKNIPGVNIPEEIVERLRKTPKGKKVEEGKKICIEIIQQVREIEGVSGIHMMAFHQNKLVTEIIDEVGLLPRSIAK
jgi:methylenetetrahydrofolate reductase (NADPH)